MIQHIVNLAIDKGIIKELDVHKTIGGSFTSADANGVYAAATDIGDGN